MPSTCLEPVLGLGCQGCQGSLIWCLVLKSDIWDGKVEGTMDRDEKE